MEMGDVRAMHVLSGNNVGLLGGSDFTSSWMIPDVEWPASFYMIGEGFYCLCLQNNNLSMILLLSTKVEWRSMCQLID